MFDIHNSLGGILPTIFGFPTYTFFVLLGIAVGVLYYLIDAKKRNATNEGAIVIVAAALIFGMLGSKVPLLFEGKNLVHVLTGKSIVGGLVGGMFGVIFIKRLLKIKLKMGNVIAPAIALGCAIGRWGCFFNGCCYGRVTKWGFDFGDGHLRLPTQLFELAFNIIAFILLHIYKKKVKTAGVLFKLYLLAYFSFRLLLEFFRVNPKVYAGMSIYQIICLLGIPFILLNLYKMRRKKHESKN